ncbi:hypothetical protein MMC24_004815 [Lignoscripta atroalba]|nr:hypothetical protein [Lignoscripta atroalba]
MQDYFYVCQGHLKDRGFCSPIVDEAEAAAKKKKEDLDREIELIRKEYEEKLKKKKAKNKDKDKKAEEKEKEKEKEEQDDDEKAKKEQDDKIKALTNKEGSTTAIDSLPRIYALHKSFYQIRLDRIRSAEVARRNQQRLKTPSAFPSVPSGDL